MDADIFTVEPHRTLADLYQALPEGSTERRQRLYPVVDKNGDLGGVLPWSAVLASKNDPNATVADIMLTTYTVAHPDEILRAVADRMAVSALGVLPVVERGQPRRLQGLITHFDILNARQKLLEEERHAERVLTLRRVSSRPKSTELTADSANGAKG
jgi:CBS domain-containing protein